jgi:hypothetical protein
MLLYNTYTDMGMFGRQIEVRLSQHMFLQILICAMLWVTSADAMVGLKGNLWRVLAAKVPADFDFLGFCRLQQLPLRGPLHLRNNVRVLLKESFAQEWCAHTFVRPSRLAPVDVGENYALTPLQPAVHHMYIRGPVWQTYEVRCCSTCSRKPWSLPCSGSQKGS